MKKYVVWAVAAGLLGPYVATLAWTGNVWGEELRYEQQKGLSGTRKILLDRGDASYYVDLEEYLPGVIAGQLPAEYHPEAVKAQAIIARTYLYSQMEAAGDQEKIAESALDLDFMGTEQLKKLWGTSLFPAYYKKMEEAVKETKGIAMAFEGAYITPLFCRASAGSTRPFKEAYLPARACPLDLEAEGYLGIKVMEPGEFADKINSMSTDGKRVIKAETLPESIQIGERDEAGYVISAQLDGQGFSGEEIQYALGLSSCAFSVEPYEGKLRILTKGIGHGYGFSQHTANEMAKEGRTAQELLGYFYENIVFTSE